jgi:peptidoglycan hydrolase-like protein with peptidoglycan-binding domain
LLRPQAVLSVDGIVGSRTIKAIEIFQSKVANLSKPDGKVDPGGRTFKALAPYYQVFTISGVAIHPRQRRF